jgi:hypothetical protein
MLDGIEEDPDFPGFEEIPDPANECGKFFCLFGVAVRNFQKIGQFLPDRMPRCLFEPENFRDPEAASHGSFPISLITCSLKGGPNFQRSPVMSKTKSPGKGWVP